MKFTIKQVLHANKIQAEVIGELRSKIAALENACRSHACPDDGSIDTVCYPDNHKCPARRLGGNLSNRVDSVVCAKCGLVLLRAASGATITVGEGNMLVTCKCGETTHV